MQISDMMRKISDSKARWQTGLHKLRRQSVISEPSVGESTVMDEETTEGEMQDYFTKLKKKTGLNQLWSGRKFMETIDKDPDVDLSEEPRLRRSALKQLTLDSDEEELHEFIQNLSDYDRSPITEEEEEEEGNSRSSSSTSNINLMKNINFAESGAVDFNIPGNESSNDDDDNDRDFMPLIVKPNFDDENIDPDLTETSQGNIFKTGNINFISSDVSSIRNISDKDKSVKEEIASETDGTAAEMTEEIPELDDESRVRTPATLVKSHDYTSSKFESYESDKRSENGESTESHTLKSRSSAKNIERHKETGQRSHAKGNDQLGNGRIRKVKRKNTTRLKASDATEFSSKSSSTGMSKGASPYLSSSLSSSMVSSHSSSRSSKSSSHTKSQGRKSERYKENEDVSGRREKRHTRATNQKKRKNLKVSLSDLGRIDTEMLLDSNAASKYLDPSLIATTVVDHDALEAVTSYNPTMLALNDLLRYQIQLTRQHIDNSWRLYRAYAEPDAKGTHRYTTLKRTMKYLQEHAPSVISYEEALKQVNDEHE